MEMAAKLAALRGAVAELAVTQAEGLNAMVELLEVIAPASSDSVRIGDRLHITHLRSKVVTAADRSLAVADDLVNNNDG